MIILVPFASSLLVGFERLNICSLLVSKVNWCWENVAGNLGLGAKAGKWFRLPHASSEGLWGSVNWGNPSWGLD